MTNLEAYEIEEKRWEIEQRRGEKAAQLYSERHDALYGDPCDVTHCENPRDRGDFFCSTCRDKLDEGRQLVICQGKGLHDYTYIND